MGPHKCGDPGNCPICPPPYTGPAPGSLVVYVDVTYELCSLHPSIISHIITIAI